MKTFFKLLISYAILIAFFVITLFVVHLIPNKYLAGNVEKSSSTIQEEGLYPEILNFKLFQLDNFTDVLMLNEAISDNSQKALYSSMVNNYYKSDNFFDLALNTEKVVKGDLAGLQKVSYARYWHGYLIFLRPILCFLNYSQIRILNYMLLIALFLYSGFLIYKKIGKKEMVVFFTAMLLINVPIVPLSMQFSSVFYITLISIVFMLSFDKLLSSKDGFLLLFFVIGGMTSFFDLLTAPLITLGIPLTLSIIRQREQEDKIVVVVKGALMWGLGYGLIWASKWFIGRILTGEDVLGSAMEASALRTSNLYKGMEMTIPNIIGFIYDNIEQKGLLWILWIVGFFATGCIIIYFYFLESKKIFLENLYLLLIVMMVPVWYLVLRNHSIQHGWFTWRALIVPIFAGLLFIVNTTKIKKLKPSN